MDFSGLGRVLVIGGLALCAVGLLLMFGPKLPFWGRLPGDIYIERKGFSFAFPVVTCLVISALATIIVNVFFRK